MKGLYEYTSAALALKDVLPADFEKTRCTTYEMLAQMRCDVYNDSEGKNPEFGCEKCKHRGYFMKLDADGFDVRVECECMRVARAAEIAEKSGMGALLSSKNFENYKTDDDWQKRALEDAKRYASKDTNTSLLVSGQNGSGKTHLCTAICAELIRRGYTCRYISWTNFLKSFTAARFKEEVYTRMLQDLREPQVLYIDDFLKTANKEKPSAQELRDAYEAINQRYYGGKRTIITCEWMSDELYALDSALGGRINEMTAESKIQIAFKEGRDYRLRKGKKNAVQRRSNKPEQHD